MLGMQENMIDKNKIENRALDALHWMIGHSYPVIITFETKHNKPPVKAACGMLISRGYSISEAINKLGMKRYRRVGKLSVG